MGFSPQTALLVTYPESYAITGFVSEENYGSDVGIFYNSDKNITLQSNFYIDNEYLRDAYNHLNEIPGILSSYDLYPDYQIESFSHCDAAADALANEMIPSALDMLPQNTTLPITIVMENQVKSISMKEGESSPPFVLDLSSESIVTTKAMRTSWYRTTQNGTEVSYNALTLEELEQEIDRWNLQEYLFKILRKFDQYKYKKGDRQKLMCHVSELLAFRLALQFQVQNPQNFPPS